LPISNTWVQEVQSVSNGFCARVRKQPLGTVFKHDPTKNPARNSLHGEGAYIFPADSVQRRRPPCSRRARPDGPGSERQRRLRQTPAGRWSKGQVLFFFGAWEKVKRRPPFPGYGGRRRTIELLGTARELCKRGFHFNQKCPVHPGEARLATQTSRNRLVTGVFNNHKQTTRRTTSFKHPAGLYPGGSPHTNFVGTRFLRRRGAVGKHAFSPNAVK